MEDLATAANLLVQPVLSLEVFDDNVAQLGSQRQIVRWAFEENTKENDVRRFDTENGYAVVVLDKKNKAGLSARGKNVRGILINQKKAALIRERSTGETLEEIATQNNSTKQSALAVSNASPVFGGAGRFVDIAGVVTALEENQLTRNIVGQNGVAFAVVTKKTPATDLNNYSGSRADLERTLQARSFQIYEAIKENSDIEDNRPLFY